MTLQVLAANKIAQFYRDVICEASHDMQKPVHGIRCCAGHAEMPFVIGFFSLVFGLMWTTALVAKHTEYEWHIKALILLASPLLGFLCVLVFGAKIKRCASQALSSTQKKAPLQILAVALF